MLSAQFPKILTGERLKKPVRNFNLLQCQQQWCVMCQSRLWKNQFFTQVIRDGTRVASAYGCPSSSHWNGVCRWKPSHDLQYGLGLLVTLAPGVSPHLSMPKRNSGQRRAHAGIEWLYALSLHMYIRRPRLWQQRHGRGEGWWPTSAAFPGPFSCDHYRNYGTFATLWKLRKYQCFYWGGHKNTVNTVIFATRSQKNIVNTGALDFRGANNICIYGVFLLRVCQKNENTTYVTVLGPNKMRQ